MIEQIFRNSRKEGLPEFTMQDVSKHDSETNRVWVTYKHGVYDITDFISKHPGADKIMMAAGGAVEPFWNVYAVHKVSVSFTLYQFSSRSGHGARDLAKPLQLCCVELHKLLL